jgi:hypothetical protein
MRAITGVGLVAALLLPATADAGQVYGTIVSDGKGVNRASIEIQCGKEAPVTGATTGDGSYRINVPQQGQCTFTLPAHDGKPSVMIFSSPNPSAYNFELTKGGDGKYELRRR